MITITLANSVRSHSINLNHLAKLWYRNGARIVPKLQRHPNEKFTSAPCWIICLSSSSLIAFHLQSQQKDKYKHCRVLRIIKRSKFYYSRQREDVLNWNIHLNVAVHPHPHLPTPPLTQVIYISFTSKNTFTSLLRNGKREFFKRQGHFNLWKGHFQSISQKNRQKFDGTTNPVSSLFDFWQVLRIKIIPPCYKCII